jgi:hypothetical protein
VARLQSHNGVRTKCLIEGLRSAAGFGNPESDRNAYFGRDPGQQWQQDSERIAAHRFQP